MTPEYEVILFTSDTCGACERLKSLEGGKFLAKLSSVCVLSGAKFIHCNKRSSGWNPADLALVKKLAPTAYPQMFIREIKNNKVSTFVKTGNEIVSFCKQLKDRIRA